MKITVGERNLYRPPIAGSMNVYRIPFSRGKKNCIWGFFQDIRILDAQCCQVEIKGYRSISHLSCCCQGLVWRRARRDGTWWQSTKGRSSWLLMIFSDDSYSFCAVAGWARLASKSHAIIHERCILDKIFTHLASQLDKHNVNSWRVLETCVLLCLCLLFLFLLPLLSLLLSLLPLSLLLVALSCRLTSLLHFCSLKEWHYDLLFDFLHSSPNPQRW